MDQLLVCACQSTDRCCNLVQPVSFFFLCISNLFPICVSTQQNYWSPGKAADGDQGPSVCSSSRPARVQPSKGLLRSAPGSRAVSGEFCLYRDCRNTWEPFDRRLQTTATLPELLRLHTARPMRLLRGSQSLCSAQESHDHELPCTVLFKGLRQWIKFLLLLPLSKAVKALAQQSFQCCVQIETCCLLNL